MIIRQILRNIAAMKQYGTILVVDDNPSILSKQHPQMPVVLLTAYADVSLAVKGLKSGAADFITKFWYVETGGDESDEECGGSWCEENGHKTIGKLWGRGFN